MISDKELEKITTFIQEENEFLGGEKGRRTVSFNHVKHNYELVLDALKELNHYRNMTGVYVDVGMPSSCRECMFSSFVQGGNVVVNKWRCGDKRVSDKYSSLAKTGERNKDCPLIQLGGKEQGNK